MTLGFENLFSLLLRGVKMVLLIVRMLHSALQVGAEFVLKHVLGLQPQYVWETLYEGPLVCPFVYGNVVFVPYLSNLLTSSCLSLQVFTTLDVTKSSGGDITQAGC